MACVSVPGDVDSQIQVLAIELLLLACGHLNNRCAYTIRHE
jgi:hypothetical protein